MKLNELLLPWMISDATHCEITGIENDSRRLKKGDLFLAYPGAQVDGRSFIPAVLQQGVAAILYEAQGASSFELPVQTDVPLIAIENLFSLMGALAARFYGYPSQQMTLIGITGTNGKTTIAYQLAQAYTLLGRRAVYIGTLGWGEPNELHALANTTPDGLCLQRIFRECVDRGVAYVCMEVSSHALAEDRVSGIQFKQAIFTNLTRDHLDYHHTMEAYQAAKAKLFAAPTLAVAILNADDKASETMRAAMTASTARVMSYGLTSQDNQVYAAHPVMTRTGTSFSLITPMGEAPCSISSVGAFNLSNALAIISSLLAEGFSLAETISVMPQLKAASGRLELIRTEPVVMVDFAHTPDALENVLKTLRQLVTGRIILVFGCGGDRDPGKRPLMGKIASEFADLLIITNDNPRTEDPVRIIQAIQSGVSPTKACYIVPDRKDAIVQAMQFAQLDDVVLVAGKGHETYQQIGNTKHHFSDQEEILRAK